MRLIKLDDATQDDLDTFLTQIGYTGAYRNDLNGSSIHIHRVQVTGTLDAAPLFEFLQLLVSDAPWKKYAYTHGIDIQVSERIAAEDDSLADVLIAQDIAGWLLHQYGMDADGD